MFEVAMALHDRRADPASTALLCIILTACGGRVSEPVATRLYYDRAGAIAELYVDEANLSEPFERLAERPAPFTNLSGRLLVEAYHVDGSVSDWEIQFSACTLGSEICIQ